MRLSGDLYGESHGRVDLSLFGGTTEPVYAWQGCGCRVSSEDYCSQCYPSVDAHVQDIETQSIVCNPDLKALLGHTCSTIQRDTFQSVVVPWIQRREQKMNLYIQHIYTVNHGKGCEQRISFCGHPWGRTKEFYYYCRMRHIRFFFDTTDKEECTYYENP